MPNRREFIARTSSAVIGAACLSSSALAVTRSSVLNRQGLRIKSLALRDETIRRYTSVSGDNWHMTWGRDDLQYAGLCDGYGDFEPTRGMYNSRLISVEGSAEQAKFRDVPGYPVLLLPRPRAKETRYYNFGVIAVDGKLYQLLSTWPVPLTDPSPEWRFVGVKLIYSTDNGNTWRNQDGSTPVTWESPGNRSRDTTMLFYEEPQDTFSLVSILQMGKDYADNRDGYVYMYSPNGSTEGTMNQLVMLRVRKEQILNRNAYEYFAGMSLKGEAKWDRSLAGRAIVHTFPSGWVNKSLHPWAWLPSVTYNAPLGLYTMANWATGRGPASDFEWFAKPSYLGFWVARNPWGPWVQIYESTSWTPGSDAAARCYSPVIAPKWIGPDGKSFWLVWTDFQQKLSEHQVSRREEEIKRLNRDEKLRAEADLWRANRPYYSFNVQRVDINWA